MEKVRIGVSACLLGEKVRYDGRHKLDRLLSDTLSEYVEFVSVCPEVELGLGVPREAIQLEGDPQTPRLMAIETRKDLTEPMEAWCGERLQTLENLCGFILKSKSPSCGLHVDVFAADGDVAEKAGRGLFARAFTERFPDIPVAEAEALHNLELREKFMDRVFSFRR